MNRVSCLLALLLATCFSASCKREPSSIGSDRHPVLRIATSFNIQNLDPVKSGHYFLVEYGVVELPLIRDESNHIVPWLLESYEQVDELNWRLRLNPNVKFQNGKALTAPIMAAAMNRQIERSPATKASLPGAKIAVSSERELILTTLKPDPTVPATLADESVFPIYDVEKIEQAGNERDALLNCACYTGPYRLASLNDRELSLVANTNYWRGVPPLGGVVVRFVPDAQARILAVQNGEVDIALYPPTEAKRMLANITNAFFVANATSGGGPSLLFNVRYAPFNESAVRRGISLGLNYETLAQDLMDGVYDTASGFYPPSFSWAVPNQKTDVEEAKRLLSNAGWLMCEHGVRCRNGKDLKAVLLTYPQQPDWVTLATAIQGQLNELGIPVTIKQVDDINNALTRPADWDLAIYATGLVTTGGAPDSVLAEHFGSGAEENYGGIADTELNKLIDELGQTFESVRRAELLKRIQVIVIAEQAYLVRPVFSRPRVVVGPSFRSYKPSIALHHVTYETKPG